MSVKTFSKIYLPSIKMKKQKLINFPKDLIQRIEESVQVPQYLDFTTKVFMLLEIALLSPEGKKKDSSRPNSSRPRVERRARNRTQKEGYG